MGLVVAEEAYKTDTGRQRHANEDSYFASSPVFAVADGMGGAQAGEVASRIAAGAFEHDIDDGVPAESQLEGIAQDANREIHELAQRDSSRAGMGTTLTAALLRDDEVALSHVGDSRAYVLRGGELKRLTKDHSLVEELRRQGRLTDEEAEEHPQRSIITRALGPEPSVNVDTMTFPAKSGDVFLLCSDGLTTMVSDEQIARHPERGEDAAQRGQQADRRGQRPGRARQHHRGRLPGCGGGRGARGGRDADLAHRRTGGADQRADAPAGDRLRGQGPMPLPHKRTPRGIKIAAVVGRGRGRARSAALQPRAPGLFPRHRRGRAGRASTAACPTTSHSGSSSTPSSSRSASRPPRSRPSARRS